MKYYGTFVFIISYTLGCRRCGTLVLKPQNVLYYNTYTPPPPVVNLFDSPCEFGDEILTNFNEKVRTFLKKFIILSQAPGRFECSSHHSPHILGKQLSTEKVAKHINLEDLHKG